MPVEGALSPDNGALKPLPSAAVSLCRPIAAKHGIHRSLVRPHDLAFLDTDDDENEGEKEEKHAPHDIDPFHVSPPVLLHP